MAATTCWRATPDGAVSGLARMGDFGTFSVKVLRALPSTLRRYPGEYMNHLTDIAWGTGALLVGGGTIGIMVLLSVAAGTSLGIEGFSGLELLGLGPARRRGECRRQHPRARAAHRRARARVAGRLPLHGADRLDEAARGDRRAQRHGGPADRTTWRPPALPPR